MSPEKFDHLLSLVTPLISKKDTKFRKSMPSNERLALTLRPLASGELQILLSFQFLLGRATVSKIISDRCEAIYQVLSEKYLRSPKSTEEWKTIAQQFEDTWYIPHIIGAIDGKHVRIKCPKTLEVYTTTTRDFLALLYQLPATLITALRWFDVGQ